MTTIPHTDWERLELLKEIECGDKVVIPVSYEHAVNMLNVASKYIQEQHQQMWKALQQ
jgi:hypothetical protein